MTSGRAYAWQVNAQVTVAGTVLATAQTALTTMLGTIKAALPAGTEFSVMESGGAPALTAIAGGTAFAGQGSLVIGADASEPAAGLARTAATAIATAVSGSNPAIGVTLEQEAGQFVLQEIG